jgi:hypothetical protein
MSSNSREMKLTSILIAVMLAFPLTGVAKVDAGAKKKSADRSVGVEKKQSRSAASTESAAPRGASHNEAVPKRSDVLKALAAHLKEAGEYKLLNKVASEKLGYSGAVRSLHLRDILQADTSGYSTSVNLTLKDENGESTGEDLLIGQSKTYLQNGESYADVIIYRCTLNGDLIVASRGFGKRGSIRHEFWDVNDAAVLEKFEGLVTRLAKVSRQRQKKN